MPLILSQRNDTLVEWMDRPDCDALLLQNTYRQFTTINRLLSGWNSIYKNYIRPILDKKHGRCSILDIGCGGGDIIRLLHKLCEMDGYEVEFTGIDPDSRSMEYLTSLKWPDSVTFRAVYSHTLIEEESQFDIVISNHLVHHLNGPQLLSVCNDAEKLTRKLVIFSDIERSDLGYISFSTIAPLIFRNSYIVTDGKISIRRSYRKPELVQRLPQNWSVRRMFPFRLLATYENRDG